MKKLFLCVAVLTMAGSCNAMIRSITPEPPKTLPRKANRKKMIQEWGNEETRIACMQVLNRVREEEKNILGHSRDLAKKIMDIIKKRKDAHKERNTLGWDY